VSEPPPRLIGQVINSLAKRLRGLGGKEALSPLAAKNDPFLFESPAKRAKAEWFAALIEEFGYTAADHVRDIHYDIATKLGYTYYKHDDTPYRHVATDYRYIVEAAAAARHLGLVAALTDNRSPDLLRYAPHSFPSDYFQPSVEIEKIYDFAWDMPGIFISSPADYDFPSVEVSGYYYNTADQPVEVEVWVEKHTAQRAVEGICSRLQVNLQWGVGFFGIEIMRSLVERARRLGKPVRVLYLADYDPAGIQMPVSMSRHVEYILHEAQEWGIDIKVEVIGITPEQIVSLELPRPPLETKADHMDADDESRQKYLWAATRRDNFEMYLGEGGTELNAIDDAELTSIIRERVEFYRDEDLEEAFAEAEEEAQENARHAVEEIEADYADELAELRRRQEEVIDRYRERVEELNRQMAQDMTPIAERSEEIRHVVEERLAEIDSEIPPRPEGAFEDRDDDAYLYDSSRHPFEQMRHYRRRQGKEREWAEVEHRLVEGE